MLQNGTILVQAVDGIGVSVATDIVWNGSSWVCQFRFYDDTGALIYTLQCSSATQSALKPVPPPHRAFPTPANPVVT